MKMRPAALVVLRAIARELGARELTSSVLAIALERASPARVLAALRAAVEVEIEGRTQRRVAELRASGQRVICGVARPIDIERERS